MHLTPLTAISPLDGRYYHVTKPLAPYFSEYGLIRYRILAEVEYFIALVEYKIPELSSFPKGKIASLRALYKDFDESAATEIKEIEKRTNHDVKAVEYYLKKAFEKMGLAAFNEFIHFGLTSQDINNTASPLLLKEFIEKEYLPEMRLFISRLEEQSKYHRHAFVR